MILGHGELADGSPANRLDVTLRIGHRRSLGTSTGCSRENRGQLDAAIVSSWNVIDPRRAGRRQIRRIVSTNVPFGQQPYCVAANTVRLRRSDWALPGAGGSWPEVLTHLQASSGSASRHWPRIRQRHSGHVFSRWRAYACAMEFNEVIKRRRMVHASPRRLHVENIPFRACGRPR
jgi:hypothetical protein